MNTTFNALDFMRILQDKSSLSQQIRKEYEENDDGSGYIITTVPYQSQIDDLWTLIPKYHFGYSVLLVQEVETISEFFPNTTEQINTPSFKVEICYFEKVQNNIFEFQISNVVGFPVCGALGVCDEVLHAIHIEHSFSILQIAVRLKKIRKELFQTFEEYDLCYRVIDNFIQSEHTFAVIE